MDPLSVLKDIEEPLTVESLLLDLSKSSDELRRVKMDNQRLIKENQELSNRVQILETSTWTVVGTEKVTRGWFW